MAWKGVHLTRPATLTLRRSQLSIVQDEGEVTIPIEDIAWIVADNLRTTVSLSVLCACSEAGIAVLISNSRHMPTSITLPFHTHHRTAAIAKLQLGAGLPLKKRLWQKLVRAKIENQASALTVVGVRGADHLRLLGAQVGSGDPGNIEARAAKHYWSSYFEEFARGNSSDVRNMALNYGYSVIRGCVARALVACGFLPSVGIHHDSVTNAFNLVDDIIEPFRPFADLAVQGLMADRMKSGSLEKEDRQILANLPLEEVQIDGSIMSLLHASERAAQSLVRALEQHDASLLKTPEIPGRQRDLSMLAQ